MKPSAKQEIPNPAPAAVKSAAKAACSSLTKAGAACKAPPTAGGACPMHSTRYSEEQKALWRLRGGHAARTLHPPKTFVPSDMSSAESILAMLDECANQVRSGSLAVSQANAVSKLAAVALKVGELKLSARLAEFGGDEVAQARATKAFYDSNPAVVPTDEHRRVIALLDARSSATRRTKRSTKMSRT